MSNLILSSKTILLFIFLFICCMNPVSAQTTPFTYQGRLTQSGNAANSAYDMQFRLFDVADAGQGTQQGATVSKPAVQTNNGVFTVTLDFGSAVFASGVDLYLEMSVRPSGSSGGYTSLAPRQKLTSTPYSVRSINAASADGLSIACAGCVQDSHITSIDGSKVTGTVANAATATTAGNVTGIVAVGNGGTGSATQNFVDLTSDQTIDGNKTFNGNVSANTLSGNGAGLTNVFPIQRLDGVIGSIPPTTSPRFIGSTTTVTVNGSQRITGSVVANLGLSSAGSLGVYVFLCYQNMSGGIISPFNANPPYTYVSQLRSNFALSDTTVPAAGDYRVGYCISNPNNSSITNNDRIQGWVMVTNN